MFRLLLWDIFGRFSSQIATFVVSIILTRLLSPTEFGTFGIVMAIVVFSSLFLDFGFRFAIVQAKEVSRQQLSTVFFLNSAMGVVLCLLLITAAPAIESFYQIPGIARIIAVVSVLFVINGLTLVPLSLLQREMRIKPIAVMNTLATAVSGTVAVVLAYNGFTIWSLIAQQIVSASAILLGSLAMSRWFPLPSLRFSEIKSLWTFGSKLFASSALEMFFIRLDVFIIGKLFDIGTLGFYNRAQSIDGLVKSVSTNSLASLIFPFFSKIQGDAEKMSSYYKRSLHVLSFATFLLSGIVFLTAYDIVVIIFSDKWLPVAPYLRLMAAFGFTYPISAMMINIISANGNSSAFLRLQILKILILLPTFSLLFLADIYSFLIGLGSAGIAALNLNAYFLREEISVPVSSQFAIIVRYLLVAALSVFASYLITYKLHNVYLHFFSATGLILATYVFISFKLKLVGFIEFFNGIKLIFCDKRNKAFSSTN